MCIQGVSMSKESGFRVRVDEDLRKAFLESCRLADSTASQEIRKFMRNYVETEGDYLQMGLFSDANIPSTKQPKSKEHK